MRKLPTKSEKRLFRCVDQKASILRQSKCFEVLPRVVIKKGLITTSYFWFFGDFSQIFTATFVKFQQSCKKEIKLNCSKLKLMLNFKFENYF